MLAAAGFLAAVLAGAGEASASTTQPHPHVLPIIQGARSSANRIHAAATTGGGPVRYHGGAVMATISVHVVYWSPPGSAAFPSTYRSAIDGFLSDVASATDDAENVFAVAREYTDLAGDVAGQTTRFAGSIVDHTPVPVGCDAVPSPQLCFYVGDGITHVTNLVAARRWPVAGSTLVVLLLPPGFEACEVTDGPSLCTNNGFCGYHYFTSNRTVYAVIGFPGARCRASSTPTLPTVSNEDAAIGVISHELIEAETDPYLDGWWTTNLYNMEVGDLCAWKFGSLLGTRDGTPATAYNQRIGAGRYLLQSEWSNRGNGCILHTRPPDPPTALGVAPEGGGAVVTFMPQPESGMATIYRVHVDGQPDVLTGRSPVVLTGLTDGTTYRIAVTTEDPLGTSPPAVANVVVGGVPAPIPGVPSVTPSLDGVTVGFATPDDGGSPILGYDVIAMPGGRSVTGSTSPVTVDGLRNGVAYTFTIVARNGVGSSRPSLVSSPPAAPYGVPPGPTATVAPIGFGLNIVARIPGTLAGAPYGLDVTITPGGATQHLDYLFYAEGVSTTFTGLTPGVAYTPTIVATSAWGQTAPVALPAVTPYGVPAAPSGATLSIGPTAMHVQVLRSPADGSRPTYEVAIEPGDVTRTTTTTSVTFPGLTNGQTYAVRVRAVDDAGTSPWLDAGSATPIDVPTPPTAPAIGVREHALVVSWGRPFSDNGSPVTGYDVTVRPGRTVHVVGRTTAIVDGLRAGTGYAVQVVARNAAGLSTPLDAGTAITLARASAPQRLRASRRGVVVSVTFAAPANIAAARTTAYRIIASAGRRRVVRRTTRGIVTLRLVPGTWTIRVVALGTLGAGTPSRALRVVVP